MKKKFFLNKFNNGIKIWLFQRITSFIFIIYNIIILNIIIFNGLDYKNIKNIFNIIWIKFYTIFSLNLLFYHILIGINEICEDYCKNNFLKNIFKIFIKIFLIINMLWIIQIISFNK